MFAFPKKKRKKSGVNGGEGACSRRRNAFIGAEQKPLRRRGRSHLNAASRSDSALPQAVSA
jgi:hypothetical protein